MEDDLIYRSPENPNSHLTAKQRDRPSYPTRRLFAAGLLTGRVLDFGCGNGADVRFLRTEGIDVTGFDPYYFPTQPTGRYDTIVCNYVLNVLLPEEQSHVLMAVSELLRPDGRAYFAVRRDVKRSGFRTHAKHGCRVYQCNVVLPYLSVFRNDHCEIYEYRHINQLRHSPVDGCLLCSPNSHWELITESAQAYCIVDPAATSPGSFLIVPKWHAADYFDLPSRARTACWLMAGRVKGLLRRQLEPIGYTFAIDIGTCTGKPIEHVCVRVVVRR